MANIIGIILKILAWLRMNWAAVLGILQSLVKALKEVSTAVIDLISLIMPTSAAVVIIQKVRDFFNMIDAWLEKLKNSSLSIIS